MFNFLHKLFSAKSSSQTTDNTICSKSTSTSSTTNEKNYSLGKREYSTKDLPYDPIRRQVEILQDNIYLVNTSKNINTVITRYKELINSLQILINVPENKIEQAGITFKNNLSEKLAEVINCKTEIFNGAIHRAFDDAVEHANTLNDEQRKCNYIKKFYQSLISAEIPDESLKLANKLVNQYLDQKSLSKKVISVENDLNGLYEDMTTNYSDGSFEISSSLREPIKSYCRLSEIILHEKDIYKRLAACEESYKILPDVISISMKEDPDVPPDMVCREYGPLLYMRLGRWDDAKRAINICIQAGAYEEDAGNDELEYLEEYQAAAIAAVSLIKDNPGFKQNKIYDALPNVDRECLKDFTRSSLLIRKEKNGKTNLLFISDIANQSMV